MTRVVVFSSLINQDLAAVSAKEAITHILGYPNLSQLKRYTMWEFNFDLSTDSEAEKAATTILTKTFFLINPNKESFSLHSPAQLPKNSETLLAISVRPKSAVNWSAICGKIKAKTGIEVKTISSSTVWVLGISNATANQDKLKSDLEHRVVLAGSITDGILVNPVSEQFEWLDLVSSGAATVA